MNIYKAIMQAADHIERNPSAFDFNQFCIPACGSPGCALGWIGAFSGMKVDICGATTDVPRQVLGLMSNRGDVEFYSRMRELVGEWMFSAEHCAKGLRLYAKKYHGDGKPATKSDSALVADLMTLVMGAKIPETANPLAVVA